MRSVGKAGSKRERILSVVFYPDIGLSVELGDGEVDNEVYGLVNTGFRQSIGKGN